MIRLDDLLHEHPSFSLPTQYRLGGALGRTTLCFHNFYAQLFPGKDTPVDLYVLTFDEQGGQLDGVRIPVGTGEAVQYVDAGISSKSCGLIAAMAVPAFDLAECNAGRLKLRAEIGTGFYVIWEDASGHLDTMHEWMPIQRAAQPSSRHFLVFDWSRPEIDRMGVVITNPLYAPNGHTRAVMTLYDRRRKKLARCELPPVSPLGARLFMVDEMFPDARALFAQHGALGAEIRGANLVEPLTAEFHVSGDLHLHHIN